MWINTKRQTPTSCTELTRTYCPRLLMVSVMSTHHWRWLVVLQSKTKNIQLTNWSPKKLVSPTSSGNWFRFLKRLIDWLIEKVGSTLLPWYSMHSGRQSPRSRPQTRPPVYSDRTSRVRNWSWPLWTAPRSPVTSRRSVDPSRGRSVAPRSACPSRRSHSMCRPKTSTVKLWWIPRRERRAIPTETSELSKQNIKKIRISHRKTN